MWPSAEDRLRGCYAYLRKTTGSAVVKASATENNSSKRRIKKARIDFISLVPRGANQLPVLYKSDESRIAIQTLFKGDIDHGEVTAIVYAPEKRDSQGDIASADVIKEMAADFLRRGGEIDIRHNGKALSKEDVYIAESFIVQKGDARFADMKDYSGDPVGDMTGSWAVVLKIENEQLRDLYREGKWEGVSMAGPAEVDFTEKEDTTQDILSLDLSKANGTKNQRLLQSIASHLGLSNPTAYQSITLSGEIDMTPEQLAKAITDGNAPLLEGIQKSNTELLTKAGLIKEDGTPVEQKPAAAAPAVEETTVEKAELPAFTGDITDEAAVRKYEYDCKKSELESGIDRTKVESIKKGAEALVALNKEYEDILTTTEETTEVRKQEAAASNAPQFDGNSTQLTKQEQKCTDIGLAMAGEVNTNRGFGT